MIEFTVFGLAAPGGSKTVGRTKAGGTFVRDSSKRAAPWKTEIAKTAALEMDGRDLEQGALSATFVFFIPRPKGHFGKKGLRPTAPARPTTRPDLLKYARVVEDALSGICYRDDSQIVEEHLSKVYGDPVRLHVVIRPLPTDSSG